MMRPEFHHWDTVITSGARPHHTWWYREIKHASRGRLPGAMLAESSLASMQSSKSDVNAMIGACPEPALSV